MSPLVVITDSDLPSGGLEERMLEPAGLAVRRAACASEDDVVAAVEGADVLLVQWAPITARVLDAAPELRFISRLGIGYDMVDVAAATARGIAVANTADYCVEEVTAHTLALILALERGIVAYDRAVHAHEWSAVATYPAACRPSERTVAVIGHGRIGARVAAQCRALGFMVLVHDPYVADATVAAAGSQPVTLDEALELADCVTLHLPLSEATRHLIDAPALARMRPGATLVNTCRGGLVDEAALAAALASGRLAGAALDVFASEPLPESSPLRTAESAILTPHAAWYSRAALRDLPRLATQQIIDFLAGSPVPNIVNPAYVERGVAEITRGRAI